MKRFLVLVQLLREVVRHRRQIFALRREWRAAVPDRDAVAREAQRRYDEKRREAQAPLVPWA